MFESLAVQARIIFYTMKEEILKLTSSDRGKSRIYGHGQHQQLMSTTHIICIHNTSTSYTPTATALVNNARSMSKAIKQQQQHLHNYTVPAALAATALTATEPEGIVSR